MLYHFPLKITLHALYVYKRFIRIRCQMLQIRCYISFRFTHFTQRFRNELLSVYFKSFYTVSHVYRAVCMSSKRPNYAVILTVFGGGGECLSLGHLLRTWRIFAINPLRTFNKKIHFCMSLFCVKGHRHFTAILVLF
jgi:hypothetical protein